MSDRVDSLGFTPQKESVYSTLLPYAGEIDSESNAIFAEIKGNLGKAVQLRDVRIGARNWISQLDRFISIYGFKFSKSDHILLVKLVFELMTMPTQEFNMVETLAVVLNTLLKKRSLLSRDDLVLPWRSLYHIIKEYSNDRKCWKVYPAKFEVHMKACIKSCTRFFHEDATQEMLDEWRPWLCPFDMMVIGGLQRLELFLPTSLPPELHHKGFKLWLDEFLELWHSFHNMPSWEGSLVDLFSRLAHNNIGFIDWTPHLPMIFTRLLRSFGLPVGTKQLVGNRGSNVYDTGSISTWIVSMMSGSSDEVQTHLTKLFKALHSFYHPSNTGRWTLRLGSFLQELPKALVRRIRRERYKPLNWLPPIPESHKLSDAQITQFVESLKSSLFVAMFSKFGSQDASMALRSLATLRPEIVVPPLLEKMYPAMETLIEPHRLIACMVCIVSVARPMLTSSKHYPEGPSHILPLLNLALPGIDPNDFKKTLVTLQMISTFVSLVPVADCSLAVHAVSDLTEHEKDLCSATAQFEDFVLSFLDRVHNLIENSSQEATFGVLERLTPEQSVLEIGLASTVSSLLQQCSSPIYMSALKKIHRFVTSNVFEVKVSGKLAANMCRAAVRIKPEIALKMFIPNFCSNIQSFLTEHPGAFEEEHLDNTFMWNLLMLSQVVRCNGLYLLPFKKDLLSVIKSCSQLQSIQAYEMAGQTIRHLLRSLTQKYPLEFKSVAKDFDQPFTEYLPIKDWGVPGDVHDLQVSWHEMSKEEHLMGAEILDTILLPELEFFHSISSTNKTSKENLLRRLNMVKEVVLGAGVCLPPWEGDPIELATAQVPMTRFSCTAGSEQEFTAKGKNVRAAIHDAMKHLLQYLNGSGEDDTKSLFVVVKVYELILMHYGVQKAEFDGRWKSFHVVKRALENILGNSKRHMRALLIDRMQLQHELRSLNYCDRHFTVRHKEILHDLLNLSVSRYEEVRKKAQACLHQAFKTFAYSYLICLPRLVANLRNPDVEEHVFKGTLYTIQGGGKMCLATKRNWSTLADLWPAVVQAQQFEKPSIFRVIEELMNKVFKGLETFSVKMEVTPSVISCAGNLLSQSSVPVPLVQPASVQELDASSARELTHNQHTLQQYQRLSDELLNLIESGKLTWKFNRIGFEFLSLLLHEDVKPSPQIVALYTKNCISDLLHIRKLSFNTLTAILEQQKRKQKKVPVDIEKTASVGPIDRSNLIPGDRPDNQWLQYDPRTLITSEEEWNKVTFIDKTHWGYYAWPTELRTSAPHDEQPKLDRVREELDEAERPVFDSFLNEDYVKKAVEYLALEEEKSTDKFRQSIMRFFKCLFRNYGDTFLAVCKPSVEQLVRDRSHDKHASSQRAAMEIIGGMITGSKHWPYTKLVNLWAWLSPLLEEVLNNFTVETINDWGNFFTFVCEDRDPRKLQWLYNLLLKNPLSAEGGAFGDSSRLYVLQQCILQQEWRIPDYLHAVVNYLTPNLAHNYKNVRDRIGSLLSSCFHMDFKVNPRSQTRSPRRGDVIRAVLPELEQFRDIILAAEAKPSTSASADGTMEVDSTSDSEEKKHAIRLCKTVVQWISTSFQRSMSPCPDEVFQLLPIVENMQSEANDEDLRSDCKKVMLHLSQVLIPPSSISIALSTIKEVGGLKSWHARSGILNYMQQLVFGNFFLLQHQEHKNNLETMLLHLLCDEQLEVREMAAVTLSGMIHCGYVELNKNMLDHFERLRSTKVKVKRRAAIQEPASLQQLIQRHAGVLGLSACVQAYPYDVPEFIPQVLVDLSVHVNDPQPIGTTVTKTLSNFRRTHHDNWHDHKRMFTDDQLVILTDLLISPNYYA